MTKPETIKTRVKKAPRMMKPSSMGLGLERLRDETRSESFLKRVLVVG